jgi:hypothetical protein
VEAFPEFIKLRDLLSQVLKARISRRGRLKKMLDPGSGVQRAPDGKEIFREETSSFCPGSGEERADFQGSLEWEIPFFLQKPIRLDDFLQARFNLAFPPGGKKG